MLGYNSRGIWNQTIVQYWENWDLEENYCQCKRHANLTISQISTTCNTVAGIAQVMRQYVQGDKADTDKNLRLDHSDRRDLIKHDVAEMLNKTYKR